MMTQRGLAEEKYYVAKKAHFIEADTSNSRLGLLDRVCKGDCQFIPQLVPNLTLCGILSKIT